MKEKSKILLHLQAEVLGSSVSSLAAKLEETKATVEQKEEVARVDGEAALTVNLQCPMECL